MVFIYGRKLSWSKHIEHICKVSPLLGLLRRIRNFVNVDTLNKIYKALVQPHLYYGCIVWDGLDKGLVQKQQNREVTKLLNQIGR